jgi:membrane protein DedA with SNARE-associated domain
VFDALTDYVSGAWWSYLLVFGFAYLDALFPVVPSETSVVTAGVLAGSGDMSLALILLCGASGAFLGDNSAYLIGRHFGDDVRDRFFRGEKARRRLRWAEREVDERGAELIVVARFIPGGRTVVTLTAGGLEMPWRRFALADAVAGTGWACYAALLGYFGGSVFKEHPWKGVLVALLIAFAVTGAIEGIRWLRKRRRSPQPGLEAE